MNALNSLATCCGLSCPVPVLGPSIYDAWGIVMNTVEADKKHAGFALSKYPGVYAPLTADAAGFSAGDTPPFSPPSNDPAYWPGVTINWLGYFDGDITVRDAGNEGGVMLVRECSHPGEQRIVTVLWSRDDEFCLDFIFTVNYDTLEVRALTLLQYLTATSFSHPMTSGYAPTYGKPRRYAVGANHLLATQSEPQTRNHVGHWVDLDHPNGELPWTSIQGFSVAIGSTGPTLAAICVNDAPRVLALDRDTGTVYRVRWTTPASHATWSTGDSQIEATLGSLDPAATIWAYSRRDGRDVALAKDIVADGATHYYSPLAASWLPIHADDLAAGRYPTDCCLGPEGEVYYGSASFVRRCGSGGWLRVLDATYSSVEVFTIEATNTTVVMRGASARRADMPLAASLDDPTPWLDTYWWFENPDLLSGTDFNELTTPYLDINLDRATGAVATVRRTTPHSEKPTNEFGRTYLLREIGYANPPTGYFLDPDNTIRYETSTEGFGAPTFAMSAGVCVGDRNVAPVATEH